jgi:hypothetical protein
MCYGEPFLELNTQTIVKSIHKVLKYFDDKLGEHTYVKRQSNKLCAIVLKQV